uniref:Mediator of RNA polymerase II transcription subunit 13 n=1 Tax=Heligmosomoides polygyrus TaxID=6339 RepID=A0A183G7M0_HELPZ
LCKTCISIKTERAEISVIVLLLWSGSGGDSQLGMESNPWRGPLSIDVALNCYPRDDSALCGECFFCVSTLMASGERFGTVLAFSSHPTAMNTVLALIASIHKHYPSKNLDSSTWAPCPYLCTASTYSLLSDCLYQRSHHLATLYHLMRIDYDR